MHGPSANKNNALDGNNSFGGQHSHRQSQRSNNFDPKLSGGLKSPTYGQASQNDIRQLKPLSPKHVKNNSSIDSFAHRDKVRSPKDHTYQSATELGLEMSVTKADVHCKDQEEINHSPTNQNNTMLNATNLGVGNRTG